MTTIEYMDKKRGPEARHEAINYDMGFYYNFIQIFGKNPWLWAFPIFLRSGGPVGDGVVWPQKPSRGQTYEMEMSNRDLSLNRDTPTENNTLGTKGEASNPGSRNEVFNPAFPEQNSMSSHQTRIMAIPINAQWIHNMSLVAQEPEDLDLMSNQTLLLAIMIMEVLIIVTNIWAQCMEAVLI
eukprot:CAMPEP_0114585960 /NCGR_PEP_ID=MMETSP0125-20121206/9337_1 /TAXON_ID=485358 ORGANISM="Aristerostoma sp., Strain ATCC 50986" /NCGR_SAMPLE_ID=MMETSP0125 /ASSEMBLY_ACC=CAM_ASM_000245 /LENGTH=181 /DNA_ID=CAMNT_0001781227 /DNA_START=663 /DNA_END=1209 /DNA_ORIENTATION=+